ncbi:divalent-cation tolerance protein CutA [Planctomicrobium sp. SH664]|uniref:divalent-cation tolerance protein CutA n=1 Tax=Planctomicrobium sp. SH664 TaxID=3448125 RepID=UPI003F5B267C
MNPIATVYVTHRNRDEALALARTLVSERLVACANILGEGTSVYQWEGQLMEEREVPLLLKTTADLIPRVTERIRELHPYECPCVVAWGVTDGNPQFLQWVHNETVGHSLPRA